MKPTAPTRKLYSRVTTLLYTAGQKRQKTAKIRLFDRNLREKKLSFQPDQPGWEFLLGHNKNLSKKIHSNKTFSFFVASVILDLLHIGVLLQAGRDCEK